MMRSMLFVPADSERKLAKSTGTGADALILDLEDSVAPERKEAARGLAAEYLKSHAGEAPLWVRVNDLRSGELQRDLASVIASKPTGIVLPKVHGPEDLRVVAKELKDLERSHGIPELSVSILALVTETPAAVLRMGELLHEPSARLKALSWGAEDLSSALGAGTPRLPNGAWRPMYEYARLQCILAAHALSVEALDTVYVDFRDTTSLRAACEASRHDGFTGRLAIHPDQVPVINAAFTPSEAELALARRIVDAFGSGLGVVSIDGKMYDIPHLKAARRLLGASAAP
jgi:citrate lyase subunit beta/citryl-CoA lyase